jgi:hypothetical protein
VTIEDWTPEIWAAAKEALRSRSSVDELIAIHEAGAATSLEVFGAIWEYCYDKPTVQAELIAVLQRHPSEAARNIGLDLARFVAKYGRSPTE